MQEKKKEGDYGILLENVRANSQQLYIHPENKEPGPGSILLPLLITGGCRRSQHLQETFITGLFCGSVGRRAATA